MFFDKANNGRTPPSISKKASNIFKINNSSKNHQIAHKGGERTAGAVTRHQEYGGFSQLPDLTTP